MTTHANATIAASGTTSSEIATNGGTVNMIYIPVGMTSTTATFLASLVSGGITSRVGDGAGNAYTVTFAAGDAVPLDPAIFASINFLKIVVGSSESAARSLDVTIIDR